jgi:hypothetical protein
MVKVLFYKNIHSDSPFFTPALYYKKFQMETLMVAPILRFDDKTILTVNFRVYFSSTFKIFYNIAAARLSHIL